MLDKLNKTTLTGPEVKQQTLGDKPVVQLANISQEKREVIDKLKY